MAKIDIVVPCYNYGHFLAESVRSVLDQSVRNLRVLIIDDASTDNSIEVADQLAVLDRRVEVIAHARNQGHIRTYNEGIEWAASDYFLLLSADDLLLPGAIERAAAVMDSNPSIGLTYGKSVVWLHNCPRPIVEPVSNWGWTEQDLTAELCRTASNFVPTPTVIARTSVQKWVGGYRASLPHSGDLEMWLRFGTHVGVARIDADQAIYRKHSAAMSNSYLAEMLSDYRQRKSAFDSFFDNCSCSQQRSSDLRKQTYQSLANQAVRTGIGLLRRGDFRNCLSLWRWATQLDPHIWYSPPLAELFKLPGPEGRRWAFSSVRAQSRKLLGSMPRSRVSHLPNSAATAKGSLICRTTKAEESGISKQRALSCSQFDAKSREL